MSEEGNILAAFDSAKLPFHDIPGGRNASNGHLKSANTITGVKAEQSDFGLSDAAN